MLDGNKRIALAARIVFLERNDYELTCSEAEETATVLRVSASEMKGAEWQEWMQSDVAEIT